MAVKVFGLFLRGDLNPGERHSRVTWDDGTVTLCPDLPFLAFLENGKENHQKTRIFLAPANPKIPGKEGENAEKGKEFPAKEKSKEFQKNKERSGCILRAATVLSRNCCADFGRSTKTVMLLSRDGPGVTALGAGQMGSYANGVGRI